MIYSMIYITDIFVQALASSGTFRRATL